jgi:hypothetical protein
VSISKKPAPPASSGSGVALPSPSSSGAAVVKLATLFAMIWLAARALLACDASSAGACLRFSDCASGLTCANGECVTPPSGDSDAATSGSSSGSTTGTSGDQSTSGDTSGAATGTGDDETDESDDSGTTSTE